MEKGDGVPNPAFPPGKENRQLYVPKPPRTPPPMTEEELENLINAHNALQQRKQEADWLKSQQELEMLTHPKATLQLNKMTAGASASASIGLKGGIKVPRMRIRGKRETKEEERKNPFTIISNMNAMMGIPNPPLWDWDTTLYDFEEDSDLNYDGALPPLRDNLEHENDAYQAWIYSPNAADYDRRQRLLQALYYTPVKNMSDSEVTKRWKVHNVTDMRGKFLVTDNYYKTGGDLSKKFDLSDSDISDEQKFESDEDLRAEAGYDNAMATRRGQLESKWRCHGKQPCIWDEAKRKKKRSVTNTLPLVYQAILSGVPRNQPVNRLSSSGLTNEEI